MLQMADLLARREAGRSYQCLHSISSVNWKQRFDCVYLSEMIYKTLLRSEPGEEKHLCSYLRSFSLFFFFVVCVLELGNKTLPGLNRVLKALRALVPVPLGRVLGAPCASPAVLSPSSCSVGFQHTWGALADNRQWAKPAWR